ncbi:MAG: hypothetical protein JWQ64_1781 [Subtercola sp.]|jgi:multiple sugar transport system permease protein|nr:hypothetical protein [Subtercola sp.]
MLSPSVLLYIAFVAMPLVAAITLSFFKWDLLTAPQFAGLANFVELATDGTTFRAIGNTFLFAIATVIFHMVGGLLLAIALNRPLNRLLRKVLSAAIFFPVLMSWAAVSLIWRYALDPNFGFVNYYLKQLGLTPPNWFADASSAMPSLIGIDVWHSLGYTMVILLAGLQSIPPTLYEAARLDGAGPVRQFWSVTVPLLSPTLLFASIISFVGAFQIFDPMFIITKGGPDNSTLSVVQDVYYSAFRDFDMGYASAKSLIIVAVILIVTMLQLRLSKRWVNYDK